MRQHPLEVFREAVLANPFFVRKCFYARVVVVVSAQLFVAVVVVLALLLSQLSWFTRVDLCART